MDKKPSLLTLVTGDDAISKDSYFEEWNSCWVRPETRGFNFSVFYGNEVSGDDLVACALALPMLSDFRAILLRHADKMSARDLETLAKYVQNPSPSTALLMDAESIDRRINAWQILSKAVTTIEFKIPYPDRMPQWIADRCKKRYKRMIDPVAIRLLADCIGNNTAELDAELNKLDILAEPQKKITIEMVRETIGPRADDVFVWLQAFGERNMKKGFRAVDNLVESSAGVAGAISLLARYFANLLKIKLLQNKGIRDEEIAKLVSLSHFFHFTKLGYGKHAKGYSLGELEESLAKIGDADKCVKTSNPNERLLIESLIFAICKGK